MLLRDGATLIRSARDVVDALEQPVAAPAPVAKPQPVHSHGPAHAQILGLLGPTPVAEDQLLRDLDVAPAQLTPALTMLEMEGKITRQPGGLLSLN